MVGDPIAYFAGRQRKFELPPHELMTLVASSDSLLLGSVFEGQGSWEQWFGRIVLTHPANDRFLEIRIRDRLHEQNFSRVPSGFFSTLDVIMGYGDYLNPIATSRIDGYHGSVPVSFLGYHITFRKVMRNYHVRSVGRFPRECLDAAGHSMHFYICSAPAEEYYGDFQDLALKYGHLDMVFIDVRDFKSLSGLLPELWGVQPMSDATKATLVDVDVDTASALNDYIAGNASDIASAGGIGLENLSSDCFLFDTDVLTPNVAIETKALDVAVI